MRFWINLLKSIKDLFFSKIILKDMFIHSVTIEFSPNGYELSLNSVNLINLINRVNLVTPSVIGDLVVQW